MYIPQSPTYNPVSPAYIVSGSGSVISEHENTQNDINDSSYNPALDKAIVETKLENEAHYDNSNDD